MTTIRGWTLIINPQGGVTGEHVARVEFDVDTPDELPSDGRLEGFTLYQGSIAYVINSAKFYVLNSNGEWRDAKNGATYV